MDTIEAIESRKSVRAFLDKPVPESVVREILRIAARAPSGGNLQPWKVYVAAGEVRDRIVSTVAEKMASGTPGEPPEYKVYPPDLTEPYNARRRVVGHALYETIGVAREDKTAKRKQLAKNFEFFGAPVGMFFAIDRQMQEGQWADLGMMMQNVMLLARAHGLHTCPQEAWANWHITLMEILGIPENEMLFAGIALGYEDESAIINTLETERAPVDEFARFAGYAT